jgi:hypothetical protein
MTTAIEYPFTLIDCPPTTSGYDDDIYGPDTGPCNNFAPSENSEVRCANCGYLRASHSR